MLQLHLKVQGDLKMLKRNSSKLSLCMLDHEITKMMDNVQLCWPENVLN